MSTVVEGDFEWDAAKARSKLLKHGVSFEEATTVFDDSRALSAPDHHDPDRFVLLGMSMLSRVLFVVKLPARHPSTHYQREKGVSRAAEKI